jgi:hypothetical protein
VLVPFDEPPPHAENTMIEINTTQPINRVFTPRLPFSDAPTGYPTRRAEPPGRTSSTRRETTSIRETTNPHQTGAILRYTNVAGSWPPQMARTPAYCRTVPTITVRSTGTCGGVCSDSTRDRCTVRLGDEIRPRLAPSSPNVTVAPSLSRCAPAGASCTDALYRAEPSSEKRKICSSRDRFADIRAVFAVQSTSTKLSLCHRRARSYRTRHPLSTLRDAGLGDGVLSQRRRVLNLEISASLPGHP